MMRIVVIIFLFFNYKIFTLNQCKDSLTPLMRYYKVRTCYKSTLPIIFSEYVLKIEDCMRIAKERNGMAINFIPKSAQNLTKNIINCEILGCPEVGDTATLISDVGYDYYSAYGNFNATEGSFCVKSVGVFKLNTKKQSYAESVNDCINNGGDLANVLTETRTNFLADAIKNRINEFYKASYVGLDDIKIEGVFEAPLGKLLQCTRYRAWAPGHPRPNRTKDDCVILDASRVWRAINCKHKLTSICEFYPQKPVIEKDWNNITNEGCEDILNSAENKLCRQSKSLYELYLKSPRIDQCVLLEEFQS